MGEEKLFVDRLHGIVFPVLEGWKMYQVDDWRIVFSLSGDGRALIAMTYDKGEIASRKFLEKIASLVFEKWSIEEEDSSSNLLNYVVIGDGVRHMAMINVSRRSHVINPQEFSPRLMDSVKNPNTKLRIEPDVWEPLGVEYSIARLVIAEEDLLREKPSLLVELVYQAFKADKIPSLLGFDVPFRKVTLYSSLIEGMPCWSARVPVTWDLEVFDYGFSFISDKRLSVHAWAWLKDPDKYFRELVEENKRKCLSLEISGGPEAGSLKCVYKHVEDMKAKIVFWRVFRVRDPDGKELSAIAEIVLFTDKDLLGLAESIVEKVANSWTVFSGAFLIETGYLKREFKEMKKMFSFSAPVPRQPTASQIIEEELRRKREHRRRIMSTMRETFLEIRRTRREMFEKQMRYSERYMKTMSSILGSPWKTTGSMVAKPGSSSFRAKGFSSKKGKTLRSYDWASGGATFYIDQDGALRSSDYEEEVAKEVLPDGTLVDENGRRIGYVEDGYVYDTEGNRVGRLSVSSSDDWQIERLEQESSDADSLLGRYDWGASSEDDEGEESLNTSSLYKKKKEDEEE